MFFFTKQEKQVLAVLVSVGIIGAAADFVLKKYPSLNDTVSLMDSQALYPKLNINQARADELEALPYIGAYTASTIIAYRHQNGDFQSLEELKNVPGIKEKNFERFKAFLKI